MSRQKENRVLPSQTRANGSVFGQAGSASLSGDFFTDSLLDDTSRIPSPTSAKKTKPTAVTAKPRRAFHTMGTATTTTTATATLSSTTRPLQSARHSVSTAHAHRKSVPLNYAGRLPLPLSTRPSKTTTTTTTITTPPRQNDHVTPPQSANASGEFKTSTNSDLSTPPRALTEVYQRIDDEEELAAAEREDRSSEGGSDRHMGLPLDAADALPAAKFGEVDLQLSGTLSEGTGMSFLKGLTDQNIANSITPAVSSHVKDMRKLGISTKPIVFNPGIKPSERLADDDLDDGDEGMGWTKSLPAEAKKLFPLSGRLNGNDVDKAHSDNGIDDRTKPLSRVFQLPFSPSQQPADQRLDHGAGRDDGDDGYSTDEDLRKREVLFKFSQFAKKMNSKSSQAGSDEIGGRQTPRPEKASPDGGEERQDQNKRQRQPSSDGQPQHQRASSFTSQASSSVNWGAIDEELPLPSIEPAGKEALPTPPPRSEASPSIRSQGSASRSKRWDNDFTGVSFQVSESPPVKSRTKVEDYVRQSAAARLSKSAMATDRLDTIGERDPREAPMRLSRSTSDDAVLRTEAKAEELTTDTAAKPAGEQVPDTPVVIFRSSTSSQDTPKADAGRLVVHGRSTSHDLMQRLARLGSSTPDHSPGVVKEDIAEDATEAEGDATAIDDPPADLANKGEALHNEPATEAATTKRKPIVAATPKVTGAWTDTILPDPDTIKTVKSQAQQPAQPQRPSYVQTPHVRAGGWVDTPLPSRYGRTTATMALIEDVTEELDTDVVPVVKAAADRPEQDGPAEGAAQAPPPPAVPKSAWASIRDQQKQRNDGGDNAAAVAATAVTDTLVLGNDTLASLDSVLDKTWRSADDLIKLSSSAAAAAAAAEHDAVANSEADTKQLELLLVGTLQTLQSNIHSARQGISKLEQEVARDVVVSSSSSTNNAAALQLQQLQQQEAQEKALLDLLARLPQDGNGKTKKSNNNKSRYNYSSTTTTTPTTLLFFFFLLTLGLLGCWYLLECTLAELMAHPLVAERYSWPSSTTTTAAMKTSDIDILPPIGLMLPTLLLRWLGFGSTGSTGSTDSSCLAGTIWTAAVAISTSLFALLRAVYRAVAIASGWTDGFVDSPTSTSTTSTTSTTSGAALSVQKMAETIVATATISDGFLASSFGMDNDEFM